MIPGDRVVQIPLDWPSRQGTVEKVEDQSILIAWDDGRIGWIHEADFIPDRIWLIHPPDPIRNNTLPPEEQK